MYRWLDERFDLGRFGRKYLRKVFPVHHAFYLGEIVLFSFLTLVLTGLYLTLTYVGSSEPTKVGGVIVPAAYASVQAIDAMPLGRTIRSVHHWAAHVMVAAIVLHGLRILVTGAYKKPRELNWLVGLSLALLAVVEAFTGYSLPFDAFAVTATRIGYGLASSIPWLGHWLAQVMFGGDFPTPHSLPRLYGVHVVWLPLVLGLLISLHLLIIVKLKHTQPRYAARVAPGRILGQPLYPEQAMMMVALFFLLVAALFALGGTINVHPVEAFGPPTAATPAVRPDWYFLWVYGLLQMVPSAWHFHLFGAELGPELVGSLVPLAFFVAAAALPFLDRRSTRLRYAERPLDHPVRTGTAFGLLAFFGVGTLAGFRLALGIPLWVLWLLLFTAPVAVALAVTRLLRSLGGGHPAAGSPDGS